MKAFFTAPMTKREGVLIVLCLVLLCENALKYNGWMWQLTAQTASTDASTSMSSIHENNLQKPKNTNTKRPFINFAHIPKAGGTTIEHISKQSNNTCGMWGSRMVLNDTLRQEHSWGSGYYHVRVQYQVKNGTQVTKVGTPKGCAEWHTPPAMLSPEKIEQLYPAPETFCIIRDPLKRLISFYYYNFKGPRRIRGVKKYGQGPCFDDSPTEMNRILKKHLEMGIQQPASGGCHITPQSAFITDFEQLTTANQRQCKHVLVLEKNLSRQFDHLMQEMGCPIRYPVGKSSNQRGSKCSDDPTFYLNTNRGLQGKHYRSLQPEHLSEEVVALVKELYKDDFEIYKKSARAVNAQFGS